MMKFVDSLYCKMEQGGDVLISQGDMSSSGTLDYIDEDEGCLCLFAGGCVANIKFDDNTIVHREICSENIITKIEYTIKNTDKEDMVITL